MPRPSMPPHRTPGAAWVECHSKYVAAAIGFASQQLVIVLVLLGGCEGKQIIGDAVAGVLVIGHFLRELIDQLAIDVDLLVCVSGAVVGNIVTLIFVATLETRQFLGNAVGSRRDLIFALLFARDSPVPAIHAEQLLLVK